LIINLAALTDLECGEEDPEDAWKTNAFGREKMKTQAWLISKDAIAIYRIKYNYHQSKAGSAPI
jgi:dTDP-4-dehydrorhamnose reductase